MEGLRGTVALAASALVLALAGCGGATSPREKHLHQRENEAHQVPSGGHKEQSREATSHKKEALEGQIQRRRERKEEEACKEHFIEELRSRVSHHETPFKLAELEEREAACKKGGGAPR